MSNNKPVVDKYNIELKYDSALFSEAEGILAAEGKDLSFVRECVANPAIILMEKPQENQADEANAQAIFWYFSDPVVNIKDNQSNNEAAQVRLKVKAVYEKGVNGADKGRLEEVGWGQPEEINNAIRWDRAPRVGSLPAIGRDLDPDLGPEARNREGSREGQDVTGQSAKAASLGKKQPTTSTPTPIQLPGAWFAAQGKDSEIWLLDELRRGTVQLYEDLIDDDLLISKMKSILGNSKNLPSQPKSDDRNYGKQWAFSGTIMLKQEGYKLEIVVKQLSYGPRVYAITLMPTNHTVLHEASDRRGVPVLLTLKNWHKHIADHPEMVPAYQAALFHKILAQPAVIQQDREAKEKGHNHAKNAYKIYSDAADQHRVFPHETKQGSRFLLVVDYKREAGNGDYIVHLVTAYFTGPNYRVPLCREGEVWIQVLHS